MKPLSHEEARQLLVKGWMTHDAMWFRHTLEAAGIEMTNQINKAAVRSMAEVEIRRLTRALGIGPVKSMESLLQLLDQAWSLIGADFMEFEYRATGPETIRWDVRRCFALDGVARLGVADQYECGIFLRIETWLDVLGVAYSVAPAVTDCMMRTDGQCWREYRFQFDTANLAAAGDQ